MRISAALSGHTRKKFVHVFKLNSSSFPGSFAAFRLSSSCDTVLKQSKVIPIHQPQRHFLADDLVSMYSLPATFLLTALDLSSSCLFCKYLVKNKYCRK